MRNMGVTPKPPYIIMLMNFQNMPHLFSKKIKVQQVSLSLSRFICETSKKIQKTHKIKILIVNWMQDMENWFGGWDATHLLHSVMYHHDMRKCKDVCSIYPSLRRETTHIDTNQNPSCCLPSQPLLPYNLVHTHFDVRHEVMALVLGLVSYTHFSLNKFGSLRLKYHSLIQCSTLIDCI